MKEVFNYWMPSSDIHFSRLIQKQVNNGGLPQYQNDVRDEAYKYVVDFNLAIDVGANVGLWAKPLTEKFNSVIAFEPMKQVLECLKLNVKGLPVTIHEHALGNVNSNIEMQFNQVNTGASHVSNIGTGPIEIKKLDDLNLSKFGLLKVDCERHDMQVLQGAEKTIMKYKPVIVVEQHPDTEYCAGEYLKSLGAIEMSSVRKDYIFSWKK